MKRDERGAMNNFTRSLYAEPCPVCCAQDGERCELAVRVAGQLVHPERRARYNAKQSIRIPNLLMRTQVNMIGWSDYCKKDKHGDCKGRLKLGHGIKAPCRCPCHRQQIEPMN